MIQRLAKLLAVAQPLLVCFCTRFTTGKPLKPMILEIAVGWIFTAQQPWNNAHAYIHAHM